MPVHMSCTVTIIVLLIGLTLLVVVRAPRIFEGHQYAKVGVIWPRNPIQRLPVLRVSPGATSQMDTTASSSLASVLRGLSNIFKFSGPWAVFRLPSGRDHEGDAARNIAAA